MARQCGLPPARAGIATGPVVIQDGDYYGRTVNRASRLLGVAAADQVLVTDDVVSLVADATLRFDELGKIRLQGRRRGGAHLRGGGGGLTAHAAAPRAGA